MGRAIQDYWSLAKIGYVVFRLGSCPQKLASWENSSHWQPQEAGSWGVVSHKNRFARVQKTTSVYGAKDSETVDKDDETGAKVIETGVTRIMKLEYSPGLCQSY